MQSFPYYYLLSYLFSCRKRQKSVQNFFLSFSLWFCCLACAIFIPLSNWQEVGDLTSDVLTKVTAVKLAEAQRSGLGVSTMKS